MARKPVKLLNAKTAVRKLYDGPQKFKGTCSHCGEPKNRHCGRCTACPGFHMTDCMMSHATGAWH